MVTGREIAHLIEGGHLDVPAEGMLDPNPETGVLGPLCPNG